MNSRRLGEGPRGLAIIRAAEADGTLKPGGTIVEGTAGNTGIGITLVANARGYKSVIVMPETQSQEKIDFLRMIGADLRLVPAKPYKDPGNYVHVSQPPGRGAGRRLGQPVRQSRQSRRPPHHHGRRNLGPDRRQGGRLHLRLRHRRHAGRRQRWRSKPASPTSKSCWRTRRAARLYGWVKNNDLTVTGTSITEGIGQSRVPENLNTCIDRRCRAHPGCRKRWNRFSTC